MFDVFVFYWLAKMRVVSTMTLPSWSISRSVSVLLLVLGRRSLLLAALKATSTASYVMQVSSATYFKLPKKKKKNTCF